MRIHETFSVIQPKSQRRSRITQRLTVLRGTTRLRTLALTHLACPRRGAHSSASRTSLRPCRTVFAPLRCVEARRHVELRASFSPPARAWRRPVQAENPLGAIDSAYGKE